MATMKELTAYQQRLVDQLLVNKNIKAAAASCGMSYAYARRVVTKKHIIEALLKARAKIIKKARTDAAFVLREQRKVYERCMQAEKVYDSKGKWTGELKFDASNANKALENIGKHRAINAFRK